MYKELTSQIIKCAYKVHKELGNGYLEKVYHNALIVEMKSVALKVQTEAPVKIYYRDVLVGDYYADIVVEDKVIVELKAVKRLEQIHEVQLVNYLNGAKKEVGLLINFGTDKLEYKRKISGSLLKVKCFINEEKPVFGIAEPCVPKAPVSKNKVGCERCL